MALKKRTTRASPATTTTTTTPITDRSRNDDDSHDTVTGVRRQALVARECTYSDFLKCQPLNFKGVALGWWNSYVKTVTHDVAYAMPWKTLKKIMTDKYCPRGEIKKLKIEMWNLKVKGIDVVTNINKGRKIQAKPDKTEHKTESVEKSKVNQSQQKVNPDKAKATKKIKSKEMNLRDFKSLAKEADDSLAKHKAMELNNERLLKAVETEYAKLWNDWYKKCNERKYDKISYDKAYKDMQQKIERLQAQLGDLKGKCKDTSCVSDTQNQLSQKLENANVELEFQVSDQKDNTQDTSKNTKFAKQPIGENFPKVCKTNALSKPVTSNSVSSSQEPKGVDNTKTRRPQPRSNTKNDRVPSASKSSQSMNKEAKDVISKVVCAMCKKCLIYVNHDKCLRIYVNGKIPRGRKHKANVSTNEMKQKNQPEIKKPKKVGFIKRLTKPRLLLRWSPTGKMINSAGKLVAPSNSESHVDCSNGDNACTSNAMEPKIKRFTNSTSLLGRLSRFVCGTSTQGSIELYFVKMDYQLADIFTKALSTDRFNYLVRYLESDKIEKYVGGLPDMINGSVMASKPKTMQDTIEFATKLMDKKINTLAERQAKNKRKLDNNNQAHNILPRSKIEADDQAIQTIHLGLPEDIYAAVDSFETAQEIWQYAGQNARNLTGYNDVQNIRNQEVNANCILMANLRQASISGTQTDSTPVYDSDGSAE
nr:reverse transcriptase domain-containing protein [Tanacetum cinerariifolium]